MLMKNVGTEPLTFYILCLCTYGVVQLGLDILEFGVGVLRDSERIMT